MNNEPPPNPQKTFCTNVPKAHFLSAIEGSVPLFPTYEYRVLGFSIIQAGRRGLITTHCVWCALGSGSSQLRPRLLIDWS